MNSALVIEFFHNVSLIIDDIVDKSPMRRGRPTLHKHFGELSALMTAGYIVADGYARLARDLQAIELLSELLKRLGVAECMQWRLRRTPLGVEDWRKIAAEDTGSMFEVCACLGDRSGVCGALAGFWVYCITAATTSAISAAPTRSAVAGSRMCVTGS